MRFLSSLLGRKSFLGLDIGGYSLKLAEATLRGSEIVITGFSQIRLPKGVVLDGLIQNEELFLQSLNTLLDNLKPKSHSLNLGLYAYTALYDRIPVALKEGEDLTQAVREEIEAFIPFDINEVYYDYFPLLKEDKYEIIFAVTKKEYVDKFLEIFSKVNLSINAIDVDVFALSNLLEYLYGPATRMVIDIGATKTLAFFADKNGPLFSREIALGLDKITEDIAQELDVSLEEAEKLKFHIPEDEKGYTVKEIYTEFLRSLREELENSLNIFKGKYYTQPDEVFMVGGGAFIPGITEFLEEKMRLPFKELNISEKIRFSKDFDEGYIPELNRIGVVAIAQAVREFIG